MNTLAQEHLLMSSCRVNQEAMRNRVEAWTREVLGTLGCFLWTYQPKYRRPRRLRRSSHPRAKYGAR